MKYNKLVRNKIPDIIKNNNEVPITHIADNEEYWRKLKEKLQEEVDEFLDQENPNELVDILEVIYAIGEKLEVTKEQLEVLRVKKYNEKGGFTHKIILDEVTTNKKQ